jgi:hypothetical protein
VIDAIRPAALSQRFLAPVDQSFDQPARGGDLDSVESPVVGNQPGAVTARGA